MIFFKKNTTVISYALLLFVVLACSVFMVADADRSPAAASVPVVAVQNIQQPQISAPIADTNPGTVPAQPAEDNSIHAAAAFSQDMQSGAVVFEQNADKKLPIASLTKLMTALVVFENYSLDEKITVNADAMAVEGEQGALKLGQTLSVSDLLYIMLIESSNRAAFALSDYLGNDAFVAVMNQRAAELGLTNTHFEDSTGLGSGSYSTARDIAILTKYVFTNYPLFGQIIGTKAFNLYLDDGTFHHTLTTTNAMLGQYGIIGGKTGYTDIAKGCFMAIRQVPDSDQKTINVILGADDRFLEMQKLITNPQ